MSIRFPGKTAIALSITVDFDGESLWLAKGKGNDPTAMSRGQYCGDVAAPRLLGLLDAYGIRSSWGLPVHTYQTWPKLAMEISTRHEIFCHGVCHESPERLNRKQERDLLIKQIASYEEFFGRSPRGYRAPSGPTTPHTLELLDEFGFLWDSSLAGGDFLPYRPRRVASRDPLQGTQFGSRFDVIEFSTTVDQEDWYSFELVAGVGAGMMDTDLVMKRWKSMLEWGIQHERGGALTITLHPQTIARPPRFEMLDRFLGWASAHPAIWLASVEEVAREWTDES